MARTLPPQLNRIDVISLYPAAPQSAPTAAESGGDLPERHVLAEQTPQHVVEDLSRVLAARAPTLYPESIVAAVEPQSVRWRAPQHIPTRLPTSHIGRVGG